MLLPRVRQEGNPIIYATLEFIFAFLNLPDSPKNDGGSQIMSYALRMRWPSSEGKVSLKF